MSEDAVREHLRSVLPALGGEQLPPHYPTCLGCGPDAEHGFHLSVRRDGDEVVTRHVFSRGQSGAPGIAHGGAVATVVDDLLGYLLWVVRKPAVTRLLEVEYLEPVMVGEEYEVRGVVDSVEGRKVWVRCTGTGPDGTLTFRGRALFLEVPLSHFSNAVAGEGRGPVAL